MLTSLVQVSWSWAVVQVICRFGVVTEHTLERSIISEYTKACYKCSVSLRYIQKYFCEILFKKCFCQMLYFLLKYGRKWSAINRKSQRIGNGESSTFMEIPRELENGEQHFFNLSAQSAIPHFGHHTWAKKIPKTCLGHGQKKYAYYNECKFYVVALATYSKNPDLLS